MVCPRIHTLKDYEYGLKLELGEAATLVDSRAQLT